MTPTAYPLCWPAGWPRSKNQEQSRFKTTLPSALKELADEVRLLGGKSLLLSSNVTLGAGRPADKGVVAYFLYEQQQVAIPCDRWHNVESNVRAIAPTINAMRGMERWGAKHMIRVMDVRMQRLQDISEGDAFAEGVVWSDHWRGFVVPGVEHPNKDFPVLSRATAKEMYAALWDVINGPGEWLRNPWVVAISFERMTEVVDANPR